MIRRMQPTGRLRRSASFAARYPTLTFFGVAVVSTFLLRLGWGWTADRRLADAQRAIAERGVAVVATELPVDLVPDSEDAWPLIERARSLNTRVGPSSQNQLFPEYPPFGMAWQQFAKANEVQNARVFELLRQARERPKAKFREGWASPLVYTPTPYVNMREVADTLADGALYAHMCRDDVEAMNRLIDLVHMARLVQRDPVFIGHLMGAAYLSLALNRAQVIAPGLDLRNEKVREVTRHLQAQLLDEDPEKASFVRSFEAERIAHGEHVDMQRNAAWFLKPLATREQLLNLRRMNALEEAARAGNMPKATLALAPDGVTSPSTGSTEKPTVFPRLRTYLDWYWPDRPSQQRDDITFIRLHFNLLAERRVIAVCLAMQLYRANHEGRWPDRLDQLVPDYLSALPADPFYADGRPIGYELQKGTLPNGANRPLLYFGVNEHGTSPQPEPMLGWQNAGPLRIRQYRDVARWTPKERTVDRLIAEEAAARRDAEEAERLEREENERKMREEGLLPPIAPPQPPPQD